MMWIAHIQLRDLVLLEQKIESEEKNDIRVQRTRFDFFFQTLREKNNIFI